MRPYLKKKKHPIQGPDEFVSVMAKVTHLLFVDYRNYFLSGLGFILIIALGSVFLHYYQENERQTWTKYFFEAEQKTGQEAVQAFEKIATKRGFSNLRALAFLKLASLYEDQKMEKDKIGKVLERAGEASDPMIRALAQMKLAVFYEEEKKYDEASKIYESMKQDVKNPFSHMASMSLYQVLLASGKVERASKLLEDLEKQKDLRVQRWAQEKKALLLLKEVNLKEEKL